MVLYLEERTPVFVRCHDAGTIIPVGVSVMIVVPAAIEIVDTRCYGQAKNILERSYLYFYFRIELLPAALVGDGANEQVILSDCLFHIRLALILI